jgi:deoxyribonuclease-4
MLGSNVPTIGGPAEGFRHGDAWGCQCIQIYITRSRQWAVEPMSDHFIASFKAAWSNSNVREVVVHVPFLVNLASGDPAIREKSVERLTTEMRHADLLGIKYLVFHPGSSGSQSRAEGIAHIVEGLNRVIDLNATSPCKILLETMAGQGTTLGSRFEELAEILRDLEKPERSGVCFDTAHAFISGYQFIGYDGYLETLEEFDRIVGIHRIGVIHLNDSKTPGGSRNDRHAAVGEGHMGLQVFHALLRDDRFRGIPMILEIPERDEKSERTLQMLRDLVGQRSSVAEPEWVLAAGLQMKLVGV